MAEHCIVAPGGSSSSKWWFSAANGSWKLSFEYVCVAVIYYHSCKNWLRSCIRRAWSSTAIGVADWREMSPIHKNNDMPSWTRSYGLQDLFRFFMYPDLWQASRNRDAAGPCRDWTFDLKNFQRLDKGWRNFTQNDPFGLNFYIFRCSFVVRSQRRG